MSSTLVEQLDAIFKPRSVAVVGAGTSIAKWGGRLFIRLKQSKFRGASYPVNPRHREILGEKAYASILDIEGPIDLAVLSLPAEKIPDVLADCCRKGVKGAVIVTADFAETGDKGRLLEEDIVRIARAGGLRFVGPNCMGIWSSAVGLNLALPKTPVSGHLAFISQSGTYGITLAQTANDKGFGLSKFISFGNQADLLVSEYLAYLEQDQDTRVIALYLEGLKDGRAFFETARRVSRSKPILVYKGGSSPQGARATISHTASVAGEDRIFDAMCRQAGIIRVTEIEYMFVMAEALIYQPLPAGNRIGVIGSGGQGVVTTDALASYGLDIPDLDGDAKSELRSVLPSHAPIPGNPVDFAGGNRSAVQEADVAHKLASLDYIDGLITNVPAHMAVEKSLGGYMKGCIEGAEHFSNIPRYYGKPVVALRSKDISPKQSVEILKAARIPMYDRPEDCARAMAGLVQYAEIKNRTLEHQSKERQMDMTPYIEMAKSVGFEHSERVAKLFQMIADQDEAVVILAASPPATVDELAGKTGFSVARTQELLDGLFVKGLIYKSKKPDAIRYYKFRNFIQFHDGTVLTPGISQAYLDAWKAFEKEELMPLKDAIKEVKQDQFMRVVPVNITVESQTAVSAPDDVVKMVNEAEKIAVTNCSCRVIHGVTNVPLQVCMQLDKAAYYALDRGTGRELSRQEAVDMLKMCEEVGLVHCVNNTRGLGYMICNCDGEACENWALDKPYSKNFTAPSRFRAVVDEELCISCENCVDRCFFEAVTMTGPDKTAVINHENCMGCGVCIPTCDGDAITMKEVAPIESIPG